MGIINLIEKRKEVTTLLSDLHSVRKQYKEEKNNLKRARRELKWEEEAQTISQQIAQMVQQKAHERIEGVVSKCLEAVFGDAYGFKIHFERKRGRTEAKLVLLKDGHEIEDVLNSDSGGVIDVAALALRLACIVLAKPTLRRTIIMDEPFRNLDLKNREHVRILLEELAKDFKVQFIVVTHEIAFQTGKVIEL